MTKTSLIPDATEVDSIPLPLIVAKHFDFPLAHIQTESGLVYAVQDWLRGLLSGDVRKTLAYMRRTHPELKSSIDMLPYRPADNKIYKRPYTNTDGLLYMLVHTRLSRGRSRLADIRNFIANLTPEYEYLKCSSVKSKMLTECEFQLMLIAALKMTVYNYKIHEYYPTPSRRVIDILIRRVDDYKNCPNFILIECKVKKDDFYKAVGQIACYNAEISRLFNSDNATLAIAMPYEIIDDYMRDMAVSLSIRLISPVNGVVIDAITNEPFSL
jgi:hypothetical protein